MRHILKISFILFFISLLFPAHQSYSESEQKNRITDISVSNKNNKTEVRFKSDQLLEYKMFTVDNPPRLVLDFKNCNLAASKSSFADSGIFKSVRTSLNAQGQLRIVLDLKDKTTINKSNIIFPDKNNKNYYLSILFNDPKSVKNSTTKNKTKTKETLPKPDAKSDKVIKLLDQQTGTVKYVVKQPSKKPIVIIDAGHGGKDPGTIGKYIRSKEKHVTLGYARELKKELDKTGKFQVFLTRDADYFIPLNERVAKSRKLKADLFISLHADSSPDKSTTGLSIYTLSETSSDKQAELLAQKENKSDIIGGADFSDTSGDILKTLINMSQRSTMNDSAKFAETAIKALKAHNVEILQKTHRFAGFRVLTAPDVPSVLIELGYLSNRSEERTLSSLKHRKDVASALVSAVDQYLTSVK